MWGKVGEELQAITAVKAHDIVPLPNDAYSHRGCTKNGKILNVGYLFLLSFLFCFVLLTFDHSWETVTNQGSC